MYPGCRCTRGGVSQCAEQSTRREYDTMQNMENARFKQDFVRFKEDTTNITHDRMAHSHVHVRTHRGGFVEVHNAGIANESNGDAQAALHAPRERASDLVCEGVEFDLLQPFHDLIHGQIVSGQTGGHVRRSRGAPWFDQGPR